MTKNIFELCKHTLNRRKQNPLLLMLQSDWSWFFSLKVKDLHESNFTATCSRYQFPNHGCLPCWVGLVQVLNQSEVAFRPDSVTIQPSRTHPLGQSYTENNTLWHNSKANKCSKAAAHFGPSFAYVSGTTKTHFATTTFLSRLYCIIAPSILNPKNGIRDVGGFFGLEL